MRGGVTMDAIFAVLGFLLIAVVVVKILKKFFFDLFF